MRRFFFLLVLLTLSASVRGQETRPTSSFTITGEVKSPSTINVTDLSKWTVHQIGDVVITNHLGEKRSEAKGLKGVLLKDILAGVSINAESPKVLSEYFFVCKANDQYTVVYSWNEIFNTVVGESAFIVTEKDGKPAAMMDDAILMLSPKDKMTGRRHVKSLVSIEVHRAR